MGGVFNHINSDLYHYAGNSPVKYTDPTGMWTITLGIGAGLAGKVKIGHNEGKWEFSWKVGFGAGEALKVDFVDSSFVESPKLGIYSEANGVIESDSLSAGGELKLGIEGNCETGDVSLQTELSVNATGFTGESSSFGIINGEMKGSEITQNAEYGEEAFLFIGFGGEGYYEEKE